MSCKLKNSTLPGDYNGHFQEAHMYKQYSGWPYMLTKRHWERLGGNSSTVQFQIQPRDEARYQCKYYGVWSKELHIFRNL